jgi:methyltransferase (TIGR00027 family)
MPASRTAQYVALYRALETTVRSRPPLFRDPFAFRFLPRGYDVAVHLSRFRIPRMLVERYADRRAPGARTSAIARTRMIDDAVLTAVQAGCRQLVILGAGYDCRAHRLEALRDVEVFEVDRAATQQVKRERLAGHDLHRSVRYVAVDFGKDDLRESLVRAGWDGAKQTVFIWEGVTNYLTEEAVSRVLSLVGETAAGSVIVFTYIHRGVLDGSTSFSGAERLKSNVRGLGEPWTCGIDPAKAGSFLSSFGLVLQEDLGADAYRVRYGIDRGGYAFYHVAIAGVTGAT